MIADTIEWLHRHPVIRFTMVFTLLGFTLFVEGDWAPVALTLAWGIMGAEEGWRAYQRKFSQFLEDKGYSV